MDSQGEYQSPDSSIWNAIPPPKVELDVSRENPPVEDQLLAASIVDSVAKLDMLASTEDPTALQEFLQKGNALLQECEKQPVGPSMQEQSLLSEIKDDKFAGASHKFEFRSVRPQLNRA